MSGGKGLTYQLFTSNGSWTAPAGVTNVIIVACGGGAGGQGGPKGLSARCAFGGAGAVQSASTVNVVPNTTYAVTVGQGGAGGAARTTSGGATAGSDGTASSFGSLYTAYGARSYDNMNNPACGQNAPSITSLTMFVLVGATQNPRSSGAHALSGAKGTNSGTSWIGGLGGGSGYGGFSGNTGAAGGDGGSAANATAGADGQAPSGTNYGAGGGGGGATNTGANSGAGGSGAPGFLAVCWVEA